jgi:DNA-binding response OmpR family regulator
MTSDRPPRVLVVDDSRFICDALGMALRKAGFDVRVARDLWDLEGETEAPDLILIDVVLQEAFGDEVASLLRSSRGVACPILLFSSLPAPELARRASEAGLDGYVSKRAGLPAIVDRVCRVLGRPPPDRAIALGDLAEAFAIDARQRSRSVLYVAGRRDRWNATAIVGELNALAGDADLAGAGSMADAARACRDAVSQHGMAGWTQGIAVALGELGEVVGGAVANVRKLLIIDDTSFCRDKLLRELDRAGHVVVEAETISEARQKLRATDYDVIVLHAERGVDPAVLRELESHARGAKVAVIEDRSEPLLLADAVFAKSLDPAALLAGIEGLFAG